jgi:hypothetical protein
MKVFILLCCTFLLTTGLFSQTDKPVGPTSTQIINTPVENPEVEQIVKNLQIARSSENLTAKAYWEKKLNELTKPQTITSRPLSENFEVIRIGNNNQGSSETINYTRISDKVNVANSISYERVSGKIFAAVGFYGGAAIADTLKIYKSTDNGITFTVIAAITSSVSNLKIGYNGIDIEAVSKGDSAYAFIVMNYTTGGGATSCNLIRVREDGGMLAGITDYIAAGNNKFINTRVTSDNARYTTSAYVYVSLTLDSNASGTRRLKSRMYRLEQPFNATMTGVKGYMNPTGNQYAYYVDGPAPDTAKFETDIAYVSTSTGDDHIYTVTIVRGVPTLFGNGSSLHFSRSTTFGATAPALFLTNDGSYYKESPRIASTGLSSNAVMVCARRLYAGGDWDPYSFYTTDITAAVPTFNGAYVDNSSDTTSGVSVSAKYRSFNTFLFGYNNKTGNGANGNIYIRPFTSGSMGTNTQVNPGNVIGTGFYGSPDVSFRNVNNDSCLAIFGGTAGNYCYVTGGCSGAFVSIGNPSSIVEDFQLYQNYPNPFNPGTRITYNIPAKQFVSLKIFNVLGKEVGILVNESQTAGMHIIDFNASHLSSGVYYYKLEAGEFAETKKMLLVK